MDSNKILLTYLYMMAENKKKKTNVPLPEKSYLEAEKNISFLILQKMDPDIQARIVLSAVSLDIKWLIKIFAVGCEEMYVRTILKDLHNHPEKRQQELLDSLKDYGYIVDKNNS